MSCIGCEGRKTSELTGKACPACNGSGTMTREEHAGRLANRNKLAKALAGTLGRLAAR